MKPILPIVFLLVCCSVSAQAQKKDTSTNVVKLVSKEDSVQYAMGLYFGQWVMGSGVTTVDPNIIIAGIYDMVRNNPRRVPDSIAFPMINAYRLDMYREQSKRMEQDFFSKIKTKPGVQALPGGTWYQPRKTGTGIKPADKDSVVLHFKGSLLDGTVFEDTHAQKTAVAAVPAYLVPGLKEALLAMPEGSIWELYIPAALAYGAKGNGGKVPPDNALIIVLELVRVKRNTRT